MRRAGKVDLIQPETIKRLRQIGVSVQVLSSVGQGVPDLLAGYHGRNLLIELKTGNEELTKAETEWHAKWGGQVCIARSPEQAQEVVIREIFGAGKKLE